MAAQKPTSEEASQLRVNEKKWTPTLMKAGWTVLPNVIFERQKALGLSPLDVNIILHLASYWWSPEGRPHPSKTTLATAMDVEPRSIQRRIAAMEAAGFIRREERRVPGRGSSTNIYHLDGLIAAATGFAEEKIAEREINAAARTARAARKGKPKLSVVQKTT